MAKHVYIYNGPFEAEVILAPTGRMIVVSPGDAVTLLANEAKSISGSGDWTPAPIQQPKDRKLQA